MKGFFGKLLSRRIVRFGVVAVCCTGIQELLLMILVDYGVRRMIANAIGFVVSAQINFVLSTVFTWQAKQLLRSIRATFGRLISFNVVASASLLVNSLGFAAAAHLRFPTIPASLVGVVVGACISFSANHYITYRNTARETIMTIEANTFECSGMPTHDIREMMQREGVAFFLPAYNEEHNLPRIVGDLLAFFGFCGCTNFTIIIVNDGSAKDNTRFVADMLVMSNPEHVRVVHHDENRGYGAALRTGIEASLETKHGLVAFCDSDGQFDVAELGRLLDALVADEAHLSVGYRIARADSRKRLIMGRMWHWLSTLALGFKTARDVDCGFKLFTREMLEAVSPQLCGGYAAVSPEILARAAKAGFVLTEVGLNHKSRVYGEQTGANLKVVLRSLSQLFKLRFALRSTLRQEA